METSTVTGKSGEPMEVPKVCCTSRNGKRLLFLILNPDWNLMIGCLALIERIQLNILIVIFQLKIPECI